MKAKVIAVVGILLIACAVMAADLSVKDAVICKGVEDRMPVESGKEFSADVGKVFCFTRITGAQEDTMVTHVWYHGDKEMASVELKVGSSNWRTWSSKNIEPSWTGDWKVKVKDADGNVLDTLMFKITK